MIKQVIQTRNINEAVQYKEFKDAKKICDWLRKAKYLYIDKCYYSAFVYEFDPDKKEKYSFCLNINNKNVIMEFGDWVVLNNFNNLLIYKDKEFKQLYKEIKT